ncbi:MAG: uroporphyrinogen decarboxylase family protein [Candidatus Poribacteria bacterium]
MTSKERIQSAIEGREVDYLPFSPFLAYVWDYFPEEIRKQGDLAFHKSINADPIWRGAPCPVNAIPPQLEHKSYQEGKLNISEITTPVGKLREGYIPSPEGRTNFLVEHPLKTEEDFKVRLWIEENTRFELNLQPVKNHLAYAGDNGVSIGMLIPRGKSAFQSMVEHLVGTVELVYALEDYPDTVNCLWQKMVDNDLQVARLVAESENYDYFLTWEDSGTQNYSPKLFEKYIASEIGKWCDLLKANGKKYFQHACGHVKAILKPMKECGAYGVESIPSFPTGNLTLKEARDIVGSDFCIIGGIEPVMFLNLSMKELEAYTEQVIAEGSGGPFVLANSDSCPPGVTVEKFKLVSDIAKRFR